VKLHCSPAASPSPAALSFSSHWAESRRVDFVVRITNTAIVRHLSPPKLHCSMLAEDAIKAAVSDYKQKQAKANNKRAADVTATPATTATVQAAA
jgi:nitrogen fixation NifU-like protein